LTSETRIRMAIMIEPWSCGELASEKVRAISVLPTSGFARNKIGVLPGTKFVLATVGQEPERHGISCNSLESSHKHAFQVASLRKCVVCHSNHGIQYPTDAKLGTGPEAVCMQCHSPGDDCDQARARMLAGLTRVEEAIKSANTVLTTAESSGMEVSEARLRSSTRSTNQGSRHNP